ncbi:MAG: hypothetical protein GY818_04980 [Planctomycetaceae bacterium]|nr:hypothetical protein [Planctomycetaceae bacterium]
MTKSKWMEFVDLKGRRYLKSERVRKMKGLTLSHLFSVILYCDFGVLCTAFSGTFRRENVFERIEKVMARHSEFAVFGRLLVELVTKFGSDGDVKWGGERGPFFCGINCILNIGSFAICFKGPCSTSTQRAVALNFAKESGVVVKVNNDSDMSSYQRFFDCSWISNYFEEAERLWIGGRSECALRIVSITIVRTAKTYQKMMRALFLFDAMISGVDLRESPITENAADYKLISDLMEWTLNGGDGGSMELDLYLKNEWNLFRRNREEIKLNLRLMNRRLKSLSKLVMFNVVENYKKTANGMDNVLKPEWIPIFPSLNTVEIDTNGDAFKFRFEALLESMQSIPSSVTVIVDDGGQWIESALTDDVLASYDAAGWNMDYKYPKLTMKSKER